MEVYIVASDRNGKLEVLLTCKTSEKVIPQSVVRQSDLLKAIKFKHKRVACQFPWAAACNWAAWDPWEDPGWPAADLCGALQVADVLQDGEIQTRAELISERLRTHMQQPVKRASGLGKLMTSIATQMRPSKPASRFPNPDARASSTNQPESAVPIDTAEGLLRAIEQLPDHLLQMVLKSFSLVSILRLLSDAQHPKLVMALQPRIKGYRGHQQVSNVSSVQNIRSLAGSPSSPALESSGVSTEGMVTPQPIPHSLGNKSQLSLPQSGKSEPTSSVNSKGHGLESSTANTPEVHTLTLSYIGSEAAQLITPQLAAVHAYMTPDNPPFAPPVRLICLNLSNNNLGAALDPAIRLPTNMKPGSKGSKKHPNMRRMTALDAFSAHLTTLTALQSLNLSFNSLSQPEALATLIAALQPLQWLQALDLSHNLIDSAAAAAAATHLASVTGLSCLNLSSNYIGCKGAKAITEALFISNSSTDMRSQNMRSSSIVLTEEEQAESLEMSLQSPQMASGGAGNEKSEFAQNTAMVASPMEVFDLSHNNLEPPGLLAVAGALSHAYSCAYHLRQLHLSHNCRSHERTGTTASSKSTSGHQPAVIGADGRAVRVDVLPDGQNPSKMRSKWMRVPDSEDMEAPVDSAHNATAMHSSHAYAAGLTAHNCVDMLEALIAMAPNLVAANLPKLQVLHAGEFAALALETDGDLAITADELNQSGGITFARRDVGLKNGMHSHGKPSTTNGKSPGSHSGATSPPTENYGLASEVTALAHVPAKAVKAQQIKGAKKGHAENNSQQSPSQTRTGKYSRKAGLVALGRSFASFAATLLSLDIRGLPIFAGSPAACGSLVCSLGELTALTSLNLSATSLGEGLRAYERARKSALMNSKLPESSAKEDSATKVAERGLNGAEGGPPECASGDTKHVRNAYDAEAPSNGLQRSASPPASPPDRRQIKGRKIQKGVRPKPREVCEGTEGPEEDSLMIPESSVAPANVMHDDSEEDDDKSYDAPVQSLCGAKEAVGCPTPPEPISDDPSQFLSSTKSEVAPENDKDEHMHDAVASAVNACIAAATERAHKSGSVPTVPPINPPASPPSSPPVNAPAHAQLDSEAPEDKSADGTTHASQTLPQASQNDREQPQGAAPAPASDMHAPHAFSDHSNSSTSSINHEDFVPDSELLGGDSDQPLPAPTTEAVVTGANEPHAEKTTISILGTPPRRGLVVSDPELALTAAPHSHAGNHKKVPEKSLPEASPAKPSEEYSPEDLRAASEAPLTAFLAQLRSLRHLDLSFNSLGSLRRDTTYPDTLEHNSPKSLNSSDAHTEKKMQDVVTGDVPVLQLLGAHIAAVSGLEELNLKGNGLARACLPILREIAPKLESLKGLDLGSNRVSGAVMNLAADHLVLSCSLTRLCLNSNLIGSLCSHSHSAESGVGALAMCVEQLPALQCLEVNSNGIGEDEGDLLMSALGKAPCMRCVHLRQQSKLDAQAAKVHLSGLQEWVV